uniref:Class I SAM-dependent methyltransferase n=1 Tax=Chrysotila carterae TaxID=13221 RepID=A0A7S4F8U5_CHRCT
MHSRCPMNHDALRSPLPIISIFLHMPAGGPPLQFERREELARVAQQRGFTRGAELGVRTGDFAVVNLANWPSATDYLLVDLWEAQENYHDASNYGSEQQNKNLQITLRKTRPFKRTVRVCRNYTSACVLTEADSYFDFIYVDARHDYLGVKEDLESWWPKLRPGGVICPPRVWAV